MRIIVQHITSVLRVVLSLATTMPQNHLMKYERCGWQVEGCGLMLI